MLVVEDGPTDAVPAALVLEDKSAEVSWNLLPLPVALCTCNVPFPAAGAGSCSGLDGIGGRTQIMFGNVGDTSCLAGCIGCESWGPAQRTCSAHRMSSDRAGDHHFRFATRPGACCFNCRTRSVIHPV